MPLGEGRFTRDYRTETRRRFEDWPDWFRLSAEAKESVQASDMTLPQLQELLELDVEAMEKEDIAKLHLDDVQRSVLLSQYLYSYGYDLEKIDVETVKNLAEPPQAASWVEATRKITLLEEALEKLEEDRERQESLIRRYSLDSSQQGKDNHNEYKKRLCLTMAKIWQTDQAILTLEAAKKRYVPPSQR